MVGSDLDRRAHYDARPWTALYSSDVPADLPRSEETALSTFQAAVRRAPKAPAIHFFDETLTFAQIDRESDAVAAALIASGLVPGDRVAIYLQNDPQFVVGQLAIWKAGATMVSVNPMLKADELQFVLDDSGAAALIALDELYEREARDVLSNTVVRQVITTDPIDWAGGSAQALETVRGSRPGRRIDSAADGCLDMRGIVDRWGGRSVPACAPRPDDPACLVYTSGTSGRPKGVITTHANIVFNSEVYRRWMEIGPNDVFLCGAPLFHVTGLVAGIALTNRAATPLVLFHKFHTGEALRLAEQWKCTFTVMVLTAYLALMDDAEVSTRDLSRLTKAYSGGAPVSSAVSTAWERLTGSPIRNIYGLTETTSPSHAWPVATLGPIDPATGALSVGIPVPGADVRVVDPITHEDAVPGGEGEIWIRGPMVTPGYWRRPEANATAFSDGYLRTGDVGKMDDQGWFYIVDRLKDMINTSGHKVWPREVEDCLSEHEAVREVAVVGVPDTYRGETVKAFVSLKSDASVSPADIIAFCRERIAVYKCPRVVEFLDELPKTASGKILRRELRGR